MRSIARPAVSPGCCGRRISSAKIGDPHYLRKLPALYHEFAEVGALERSGCHTPGQMRREFGHFYWSVVRPYVADAMGYLRVTHEGKQWVANLHAHVFEVEHPKV